MLDKRMVMTLLASCGGFHNAHSVPQLSGVNFNRILGREKGQKRNARPKPSGAAAMKRAATKRNNIRKHK